MKICGLTSEADASAALKAGADLLGFNAWPGSKRYLDLEAGASWLATLPAVSPQPPSAQSSPPRPTFPGLGAAQGAPRTPQTTQHVTTRSEAKASTRPLKSSQDSSRSR